MKISVVTIAFNDLPGVKKTLESVKHQSWDDIEHIIVDGGSTDGTREYLAGFGDSIRWVSEKDNGRYDAMNKGAKMATGELLWFLHSADIFHSETSASVVAQTYINEHFHWGYGLSRIVDGNNSLGIGGQVPFEHARFLIGGRIIPHQASVFDRQFFESLGGYKTEFGLTADQEFMMRASMNSAPRVWAEILCDFDANGAGSKRNAWAHYRDMIRARAEARIRVTNFTALDSMLSVFFCGLTVLERVMRRPLRKSAPQIIQGQPK
ncbi:glycosyltransferase family 2 protein [Arthrobacter humicola]|uniref:glycosyltransferase family 2 protein n=1 Tax=Arthrobacter humicola TaxID=409291 RepID=UPI001FAC7616|nr:glycosyltransferase family 2 protein [Arthrobacter humicola]MCI9872568.1 glycosyltransferase [Arthrobacter humicola]